MNSCGVAEWTIHETRAPCAGSFPASKEDVKGLSVTLIPGPWEVFLVEKQLYSLCERKLGDANYNEIHEVVQR